MSMTMTDSNQKAGKKISKTNKTLAHSPFSEKVRVYLCPKSVNNEKKYHPESTGFYSDTGQLKVTCYKTTKTYAKNMHHYAKMYKQV